MAKEKISMRKIKEVLQLRFGHQQSARQIAKSCGIARSTVRKYLEQLECRLVPERGEGNRFAVLDSMTDQTWTIVDAGDFNGASPTSYGETPLMAITRSGT
jgi:hypothetical protein